MINYKLKPLNELVKLPTKRLLAYFKKNMQMQNGYVGYWYDVVGNMSKEEYLGWKETYNGVKDELDTREHIK